MVFASVALLGASFGGKRCCCFIHRAHFRWCCMWRLVYLSALIYCRDRWSWVWIYFHLFMFISLNCSKTHFRIRGRLNSLMALVTYVGILFGIYPKTNIFSYVPNKMIINALYVIEHRIHNGKLFIVLYCTKGTITLASFILRDILVLSGNTSVLYCAQRYRGKKTIKTEQNM